MKFIIDEKVLDFKGNPVMDDGEEITWREIIFRSLSNLGVATAEKNQKAKELLKKARNKKNFIKLKENDIRFLLNEIAVVCSPLIYGRAKEYFKES